MLIEVIGRLVRSFSLVDSTIPRPGPALGSSSKFKEDDPNFPPKKGSERALQASLKGTSCDDGRMIESFCMCLLVYSGEDSVTTLEIG